MRENIGFIGLGNMGAPLASRLIDAGYRLIVHDARTGAADALVAKGAIATDSPAAVAASAKTVLLSLPTPDIVHAVALGARGVAVGDQVKTVIDLSTTGAQMARRIAAGLADHGIAWVDSPVSGGVAGAIKGTLAVMVSCPKPAFASLEALLANFGRVFFIGEAPGMGQTMKLCNNLLSATALAAASEAVVMGVKAGLDARTMIDVINAGSGRNKATEDKFPRAILTRSFDFGFSTGLMTKDVRLCLDEAEALGVPMLVAAAVRQLWIQAEQTLGPDQDFTRIYQMLETAAGLQPGEA